MAKKWSRGLLAASPAMADFGSRVPGNSWDHVTSIFSIRPLAAIIGNARSMLANYGATTMAITPLVGPLGSLSTASSGNGNHWQHNTRRHIKVDDRCMSLCSPYSGDLRIASASEPPPPRSTTVHHGSPRSTTRLGYPLSWPQVS